GRATAAGDAPAGEQARSGVQVADRATAGRATAAGDAPAGEQARSGEVDPALALALVARLQASAPPRRTGAAIPSSPLAIVRLAIAEVVTAWRECAERIAQADAVLAAAGAEIEREARA